MKKYLLFFISLYSSIFCSSDTFVVATFLDDLISLDPAEIFEIHGLEYAFNTYDTLTRYYSNEMEPKGLLAEKWSISKDGKTYTFILREGIKFASGNPVTANDAAFSLQRIIQLNKSPAYLFTQFGWSKDNIGKMIVAKDAKTLVLKTEEAFAPSLLLYCLSSANAAIVDKKELLLHEKEGDLGNEWLRSHHAGSGPFMLESWKANTALFLVRNNNYFRGPAKLKKIVLRSIQEESTQKMLLMKGDIDLARNLGLDQLEGVNNIDTKVCPSSITYVMHLNQKNKYLKMPQVRQAIKYLIDYKGLESITRGKMSVHQSFIPKGFLGAYEEAPFQFNLKKAKDLLKSVNLEKGFTLNLDSKDLEIAQALQAMFIQANIKINILPGDSKQILTKFRNRKHDLCLSNWVPDYCDPHNNALTFAYNPDNSDTSQEKTLAWRNNWEIPELNKWTKAAMKEKDTLKRKNLYVDLQKYFHDNAPFVNLFQVNKVIAQRKESLQKGVYLVTPQDVLCYYTSEKE